MTDPASSTALSGNLFALLGACAWAVASLFFVRVPAPAAAINLAKNAVVSVLFLGTLVALSANSGEAVLHGDAASWTVLSVSALFGLAIGDTCHFRCLQMLGPRRALVLETLAPIFAAILAYGISGESLAIKDAVGIGVTLAGVMIVLRERMPDGGRVAPRGVLLGVAAAFCQGAGATLSKRGIELMKALPAPPRWPALEASFMRLLAASALGIAVAFAARRLPRYSVALGTKGALRMLLPGALIGTFIGVWLSLLAYERTSVAVASTLLALSPVLVIPLAVAVGGERMRIGAVLGALLAVAGVGILFMPA